MKQCYRAGIDIGSTTAKLVILDERGVLCYGDYRRHCAHITETLAELLEDACAKLGPCDLRLKITGSGAINLGKALNIGFVQEVVAVASSLQAIAPQTDVAIELGGEDAKIIYFRGGLEERMNGVCAGGTGSFIDQMAALLQTDAEGLNRAAADYHELYPIASRCGVFAKPISSRLSTRAQRCPIWLPPFFRPSSIRRSPAWPAASRSAAALPSSAAPLHFLPELKGLHPHAAPDAGEYRRSRQLPSVCCHGRCPRGGRDAEPADAAALGQDMKCCRIKDGAVDDILLNEACSSGCGSFLDTFAQSLGMDIRHFAKIALSAKHPVDLGSRCTVFMNSRVREAQKNGVSVADISAGLSYSVIKNALYKVIRLKKASDLGDRVVVQGGTFYNDAVLRALELLLGREVIRPDVAGLMGAYGMALITRDTCPAGHVSTLVTPEKLKVLSYTNEMKRCPGCGNHCMITLTRFNDGRAFVSGNRCERGASLMLTGKSAPHSSLPNMYRWKEDVIWHRRPLSPKDAKRGTVGIPRVLNMYEDFPFWHAFFGRLGYRVLTSSEQIRDISTEAMETIPSYSECFPAKLAHTHVADLAKHHPDFIWYPCIDKGPDEGSTNSYHCPMVASYPENIEANMDEVLGKYKVKLLHPFLPLHAQKPLLRQLKKVFAPMGISSSELQSAIYAGEAAEREYKGRLLTETKRVLAEIREKHEIGIVLAGRPYHVDPAVNHSIPDLINQLGMAVLSEDGIAMVGGEYPNLRVMNQWTWHSRLYRAADYVTRHPHLELVELNSFGCGLDAVVTDQVQEIMHQRGRLYTCLKIDQSLNLGAVRIRLRSLKAAIEERGEETGSAKPIEYPKAVFTEAMKRDKDYTILAPEMSPLHFPLIEAAVQREGYHIEIIPPIHEDIDKGLACVNNDACYPAIITIGSLMRTLTSGKYDLSKTAVMLSQTGGMCRASNYIGFLHKALDEAGLSEIPVLSLNTHGFEPQPGFHFSLSMGRRMIQAVIYGDALQQCLYRTRPYEKVPGSAETLCRSWQKRCIEAILSGESYASYKKNIAGIIQDFDRLPLSDLPRRPRIGIVGEIYVKFSPIASNDIVRTIEANGGEAEASGMLDFFLYGSLDSRFQRKYMDGTMKEDLKDTFSRYLFEWYRKPLEKAVKKSQRFHEITSIEKMAKRASQYLSLGNRAGEGWFLTADMIDLLYHECRGVVCKSQNSALQNFVRMCYDI